MEKLKSFIEYYEEIIKNIEDMETLIKEYRCRYAPDKRITFSLIGEHFKASSVNSNETIEFIENQCKYHHEIKEKNKILIDFFESILKMEQNEQESKIQIFNEILKIKG